MGRKINWQKGTPKDLITEYLKWRDVVEQAHGNDSSALVALLRSGLPLEDDARALIADLLEAKIRRTNRGRPRKNTALVVSPDTARRANAKKLYEYLRRDGRSSDHGVLQALREQLVEDTIEYIDGLVSDSEREKLQLQIKGHDGHQQRLRKRGILPK